MPMQFPVGILSRDWLANATFLGRKQVQGRAAVAWTKADFIDYYADPITCDPISWYFHTMKAEFRTVLYIANRSVPSLDWFRPPQFCSP
jgi:hypothetical protein